MRSGMVFAVAGESFKAHELILYDIIFINVDCAFGWHLDPGGSEEMRGFFQNIRFFLFFSDEVARWINISFCLSIFFEARAGGRAADGGGGRRRRRGTAAAAVDEQEE